MATETGPQSPSTAHASPVTSPTALARLEETYLTLTIRHLPSDRWQSFTVPREWRLSQLKQVALETFAQLDEQHWDKERRLKSSEAMSRTGGGGEGWTVEGSEGPASGQGGRAEHLGTVAQNAHRRRQEKERTPKAGNVVKQAAGKFAAMASKVKRVSPRPLRTAAPNLPPLPLSPNPLNPPSTPPRQPMNAPTDYFDVDAPTSAVSGRSSPIRSGVLARLKKPSGNGPRDSLDSAQTSDTLASSFDSNTTPETSRRPSLSWPNPSSSPTTSCFRPSPASTVHAQNGYARRTSVDEKKGRPKLKKAGSDRRDKEKETTPKQEEWCLVNSVLGCMTAEHHIVGAKLVNHDLLTLKPNRLDYDPPLSQFHLPFLRFSAFCSADSLKTAQVDLSRLAPPVVRKAPRRRSAGKGVQQQTDDFVERTIETGVDDGTWLCARPAGSVGHEGELTMVIRVYKAGVLEQIYPLPAEEAGILDLFDFSPSATRNAPTASSLPPSSSRSQHLPLVKLAFAPDETLVLQLLDQQTLVRFMSIVDVEDEQSEKAFEAEMTRRKLIVDRAYSSRHGFSLPPLPPSPLPAILSPGPSQTGPSLASPASPAAHFSMQRRETFNAFRPTRLADVPRSKSANGFLPSPTTLVPPLPSPDTRYSRTPSRDETTPDSTTPSARTTTSSHSLVPRSPLRSPLLEAGRPRLSPLPSSSSSLTRSKSPQQLTPEASRSSSPAISFDESSSCSTLSAEPSSAKRNLLPLRKRRPRTPAPLALQGGAGPPPFAHSPTPLHSASTSSALVPQSVELSPLQPPQPGFLAVVEAQSFSSPPQIALTSPSSAGGSTVRALNSGGASGGTTKPFAVSPFVNTFDTGKGARTLGASDESASERRRARLGPVRSSIELRRLGEAAVEGEGIKVGGRFRPEDAVEAGRGGGTEEAKENVGLGAREVEVRRAETRDGKREGGKRSVRRYQSVGASLGR